MESIYPWLLTFLLLPLFCLTGHVRKEVLNFTADGSGYASLDVLQAVYAVATSCPSLIHAKTTPRLHGSTYVVDLEPVGQPCSAAPASKSGVKAAVRGVLEALKPLHQAGGRAHWTAEETRSGAGDQDTSQALVHAQPHHPCPA